MVDTRALTAVRPLLSSGAASSRSILGFLTDVENVKDWGAKGDTRKVTDAVTTNGSPIVTSATAAFTAADVGKVAFAIWDGGGTAVLATTTILSVQSATSMTASINAAASLAGATLVIGTNDSDAIRAACVAANAAVPKGKVQIPAGGYLFNKLLFDLRYGTTTNTISVEGGGADNTILYPAPNFDFATTAANQSMLFWLASAESLEMKGFTLDGSNYVFALGANFCYPLHIGANRTKAVDVNVQKMKGGSAQLAVVAFSVLLENVRVIAGTGESMYFSTCSVTCIECYAGNSATGVSLHISGIDGASNTGYYVRWIGGIVDEGAGSPYLTSSTDVSFIGAKLFAGSDAYALKVDGSSVVRITDCELVAFGTANNRGGLQVLAGGVAYVSNSRLAKAGTLFGLDNAGTVIDGGGNSIDGITGSTPISRSGLAGSGQAFENKTLTELTTIAAAAFTDTTIQIPLGARVKGVSIRVTTAIPTATTFDVGVSGATTRYAAGVLVAANTTDRGMLDGNTYYASAVSIRVTPNGTPAANTGRVRVTIHYETITPPTS